MLLLVRSKQNLKGHRVAQNDEHQEDKVPPNVSQDFSQVIEEGEPRGREHSTEVLKSKEEEDAERSSSDGQPATAHVESSQMHENDGELQNVRDNVQKIVGNCPAAEAVGMHGGRLDEKKRRHSYESHAITGD